MTVFYQAADDSETPLAIGNNLVPSGERSITVRAGNSVTSYQGGSASEVNTYASINTADFDPSGGLKARTPTGSPRQGALQPTDVVSVGGTETTVQNAAALGLIEQDQHGRWVVVPDGPSRALANEPTEEAYQDEGQALPNAAIEADLGDLCASITPTTQVSLAQQLISDGEINPNTLARAAGESGQEPGVLSERINTVVEGFQAQADATLRGLGADDPLAFYEWARENDPAGLRKAMNDHVMSRSTKGYEPLFGAYIETLADHAPDDIINAQLGDGITARMEGKQVVLTIPGRGTMTYRSAIKAGLIKVSGI